MIEDRTRKRRASPRYPLCPCPPALIHRLGLARSISVPADDKRTPLHLAASEGLLDVVTFLVDEAGADPRVADRWGASPVDDAHRCGHGDVAAFLLTRGGKATEPFASVMARRSSERAAPTANGATKPLPKPTGPYIDPISGGRLLDPVVASDGWTYSRASIEGWMLKHDLISPITAEPLPSALLVPNRALAHYAALAAPAVAKSAACVLQ